MGSENNVYYNGTVSTTISGRTCQKWSDQSPHEHTSTRDYDFPTTGVKAANNYCRNPDSKPEGLWCYTTHRCRWEFCLIPGFSKGRTITGLYNLAQVVQKFIYPIIVLLGTFMDCLSISVFTRQSLRHTATAFLLITLAVVDTLALYTGAAYRWVNSVTTLYHI